MMKRTTIFRILTLLYLGAVALLCFANFNSLPDVQKTFLRIPMDKLVHFLMFLPFPVLAYCSLRLERKGVVKTILVLVAIFAVGCLIAWGTELVQSKLPYRDMDLLDFRADRIGLACGCLVTFFIQLFSRPKADA